MSRSTSIWIVHDTAERVRATFTVKHEMLSWAQQQACEGWTAVRWRDGAPRPGYPAQAFSIAELLA